MRLAFCGSSGLVADRLGVASQAGDGDSVEGPVEIAVAAPVESVAAALAAARFERCDSCQGGERCFVSYSAAVRPADEKLGGDYGADSGLRQEGWPCRVGLDESEQFGIELADLGREEPDAGGDGAQGEHGHSMLDAGGRRKSEGFDAVELPGQ